MPKIRGKTLSEWKRYAANDIVPIKTLKYITCLEDRIKQLEWDRLAAAPSKCKEFVNSSDPSIPPGLCEVCLRPLDEH